MNRHLASLFGNIRPRWDLSMALDPEFILNNSPKLRGAIMELAIFHMMYVFQILSFFGIAVHQLPGSMPGLKITSAMRRRC